VEIGPLGLRVNRRMALELPNTEGLAAGEQADLLELDPDTGVWTVIGAMTSDGAERLTGGFIGRGGLYVAVPRRQLDTTTFAGTVLGTGNQPVRDYRVLASTGHSALTAEDGTFEILDAPVYPDSLVRVETSSPLDFVPEFEVSDPVSVIVVPGDPAASRTDVGVLSVRSVLRIDLAPTMSFSPANGSTGVSELTRLSVGFNRPVVAATTGFKLVRGVSRQQGAIDGTLSWNAELTSFTFFPAEPLRNGSTYTFYVDKTTQDTEGNRVFENEAFARFDVRESPAESGDGVQVRTLSSAFGVAGDQVLIRGINFGAGSDVTFGGVEAFLQLRTTTEIVALVPESIAGQVPVKVEGTGDLPFRALPLFDDLTAGATGPEGAPRVVTGLGTHLGSSPTIVYSAVRGGSFAAGDPEFEITLPEGVAAGYLRLEVDGFPTLSFFVRSDRR
ncbi:MAG: Ig-like domain-containing protein, partial [Actinobacteria bacterium]|nr:Ig-like domain-containing protein [Actinomycetota bacterium]